MNESKDIISIALLGSIANPNVGDEAILEANLRLINKLYGEKAKVYVFSKDASYSSIYETYANELQCQVIPISLLHQISLMSNYDIQKMQIYANELLSYESGIKPFNLLYESIVKIFENLSILHIIGGGYITSMWPDMLEEVYIATRLARKYSVKYFLTGIEIYQLSEVSFEKFKEISQHALFTDFRDEACLNEFNKKYGENIGKRNMLSASLDDAISLEVIENHTDRECLFQEDYANVIFHAWRDYDEVFEDKFKSIILPFLVNCIKEGVVRRINFLGFGIGDLELIKKYIHDENMVDDNFMSFFECVAVDPAQVKMIIGKAKFNLSTRFHAAVFSLSSGTPVYSFYSDQYYKEKIESIYNLYESHTYSSIETISMCGLKYFLKNIDIEKNHLTSAPVKNKIAALLLKKYKYIVQSYSILMDIDTERINDLKYKCLRGGVPMSMESINPDEIISISVIIPIYNMGQYLPKCLETVLGQKDISLEVICVDDGSTDNSKDILSEYHIKDNRIVIISQSNHGVAYARNQGIKKARGEFLYFIDPDDWIPDNHVLHDLYEGAKKYNVSVCGGSFTAVRDETTEQVEFHGVAKKYSFEKDGYINYRDYQFEYGWVRFIYNRSMILRNKFFIPLRIYFEDPVFFVKVMSHVETFYVLKRPSYVYRIGHHSYELSYPKVIDYVRGVIDILKIAQDKGYGELKKLEEYRLTHDYSRQIARYILNEDASELRLSFTKINNLLCRGEKRIELEIIENYFNDLQNQLIEERDCYKNELNRTFNSYNWRVGKAALFFQKQFIRLIKYLIKNRNTNINLYL